jgi:hypothetical protein
MKPLSFGDVTCSERLSSWLFQNSKKVITVRLNKVQMDLPFGDGYTQDDAMEGGGGNDDR